MQAFLKLSLAAVLIGGLWTLSGCESSKTESRSEIMSLVVEANRLQSAIERGFALQSSSPKDKNGVRALLNKISTSLLALNRNARDEVAYQNIRIYLKEFEQIHLLAEDRPQFEDFLHRTYNLVYQYALQQGIQLEDFGWLQFSYNFSSNVEPFDTFPKNSWETNWALDSSFIKFSGRSGDAAWLMTPQFDLKNVKDPSFRITHLFLVNKNSSEAVFDRKKILNEAFTVYVSTQYEPGEDPNPLGKSVSPTDPGNPWGWEKLDLGPLPNSYEFASIETPLIDLSAYEGQKVTIAFYYNMAPSLGFHYTTWQISRFELIGSGNVTYTQAPEPPTPLAEITFKSRSLEPFQTLAKEPEGSKWVPFSLGDTNWAKVDTGSRKPTNSWLLSPIFKIKNQKNLALDIMEVVNTPAWENFRILISPTYRGGDPELASWVEVDRTPDEPVRNDSWVDHQIPLIDVSIYQNQDIVVAFQFVDSGNSGFRGWEVEWLRLWGEGEPIEMVEYDVNQPLPPDDSEDAPGVLK